MPTPWTRLFACSRSRRRSPTRATRSPSIPASYSRQDSAARADTAAPWQAPHRTVELSAGHFGVVLSTDQPLPGLPGLTQQFVIHAVYRI